MNTNNEAIIEQYLDTIWMEKGLSQNTLTSYRRDLMQFAANSGLSLLKVTKPDIEGYLAERLKNQISARSTARLLSCLRGFFQYQLREGRISADPSLDINNPKLGRPLPKSLTEDEVERLLAEPNTDDPLELRDKAMLELLYASGLRVTELVSLHISQLGMSQGIVRVTGKGSKERLVPMGEEALSWIEQYMRQARPILLGGKLSEVVFPSRRGREMTRQTFWHRIKLYSKRAAITKALSPHTLRHAFATHLINHGADLRVVQMLLGHSDLNTTQIYTYVAGERMKSLHAKHHPRG